MSEKKSLSAFINKNKKTKKPTGAADTATAAEEEHARDEQAKMDNAKVQKNTPASGKIESSDEEEDELEVASKHLSYGTIKENKDVAQKGGEDKKLGFGFEE